MGGEYSLTVDHAERTRLDMPRRRPHSEVSRHRSFGLPGSAPGNDSNIKKHH
jgi:hypothetical protein